MVSTLLPKPPWANTPHAHIHPTFLLKARRDLPTLDPFSVVILLVLSAEFGTTDHFLLLRSLFSFVKPHSGFPSAFWQLWLLFSSSQPLSFQPPLEFVCGFFLFFISSLFSVMSSTFLPLNIIYWPITPRSTTSSLNLFLQIGIVYVITHLIPSPMCV